MISLAYRLASSVQRRENPVLSIEKKQVGASASQFRDEGTRTISPRQRETYDTVSLNLLHSLDAGALDVGP